MPNLVTTVVTEFSAGSQPNSLTAKPTHYGLWSMGWLSVTPRCGGHNSRDTAASWRQSQRGIQSAPRLPWQATSGGSRRRSFHKAVRPLRCGLRAGGESSDGALRQPNRSEARRSGATNPRRLPSPAEPPGKIRQSQRGQGNTATRSSQPSGIAMRQGLPVSKKEFLAWEKGVPCLQALTIRRRQGLHGVSI